MKSGLLSALVFALLCAALLCASAPALGQTAFTYQGEIRVGGDPGQGELDFTFALYGAAGGGSLVAPEVIIEDVEVRDGLFTVQLDFGPVYDGSPRWLEIRVRDGGTIGPYQTLAPRRALTSAPNVLFSQVTSDTDTVDGEDAADLQVQSVDFDGTILEITEGTATFTQDLSSLLVDDGDMDSTNELNTGVALTGTTLEVTDAGGTLDADLSPLQDGTTDADADPTNETITSAQLVGSLLELIENGTVTNLADVSSLLNADLLLDGTTLRVTDGGGILSLDLSPIQDGTEDADANPANELNTGLGISGTDLELTDAGATLTADLSSLSVDDADADPTNELITASTLTNANGTVEIVEGNLTNQVDVTALRNASLTFDGTSVQVTDGGGTLSADLTSLGNDADADPTNELNTGLALSGTTVEVTDAAGTLTADLAGLSVDDADADPANEVITAAALTAGNTTLEVVEGGITNQIDVSALGNSGLVLAGTTLQVTDGGGTVAADLSSLGDDADADPTNELNTGFVLNGTAIEVTDAGGTSSVDLAGISDGNVDADADPTNELITATALVGGDLEIVEAGVTNVVDVTALRNSGLVLVGNTLQLTDGAGVVAADLSPIGDDADPSPVNELNTGLVLTGSNLELTDAGGTLTADLSSIADGVNDPDSDPANEVITSAALVNGNAELEVVEGGITNLIDIAALRNSSLNFDGADLELTDGGGITTASLLAFAEPNTALQLVGTTLSVTDSAGTLSADLASLDGATDLDTSSANELITSGVLTAGNELQITEGGVLSSVDLTPLISSSSTALYDNLGWVDGSGSVGTGPGSRAQKILEIVESGTSNRFEIDFNRLQPGTIITNLPITISQPGFYYLTGNLTNTTNNGDGIIIDESDVTIDMMGYTIYGGKRSGINSDDGIVVLGSETNIKVRNGGVSDWNGDGINALNADFSIWTDLVVRNNDGDGLVGDFNNLMVRVAAYSNGLDGVEGDDGTVLYQCTGGQNDDNGLQTSEGCVVVDSAAFDNSSDGIDVGAGSVINGCSASDNGIFGFDIALGGQAVNCVAYDNMSNGFDMASACILRSCIGSLNNGHGVRMFANSWIIENKMHENDLDGIRISSTDCHIEGNQVTDNDQVGIHATASGSFIVKNTSAGNLTNYLIDENCAFGPIVNVTNAGDITGVANADHPWANFQF
ncbi:MAG: right-handed parallel beta-helix repeat-containing protein [Acidobacteriota bacterium]